MRKSQLSALTYRKCVGIMVLNRENKIWMGHRPAIFNDEFKASDGKRWQMPQGGIEKGEKPLLAAKRELWEETGIKTASLLAEAPEWLNYDLPADLVGTALKGKYRGQTQKWFAFRFEGSESEINITHPPEGAPIEFDQWQWVDIHELPLRIVKFKRQVYEQVVNAFQYLTK
ncbi:MAG: RNA pyrophosphohydrolase [Hyphomicrobiales bacterium]|nr:RNA pyrophosphohydrolase [Hyphomicrobiales bacterium]